MSVSLVSPGQGRYTEQQSRTHSWPGPISKHTLLPRNPLLALFFFFFSSSHSVSSLLLSLADALCLFLSGTHSPLLLFLPPSTNTHTLTWLLFFLFFRLKSSTKTGVLKYTGRNSAPGLRCFKIILSKIVSWKDWGLFV